ncbi:Hypothetical predicted protein [Mytilus galloprovincialis]|uniref:Titin n=1 Tax=Mytilus galloprovincialis TaxID=29158 RepID=A0A8B6CTP2_MYTGA|nr:Hypothetical predicted protein [Mytilus galloprovincialis]
MASKKTQPGFDREKLIHLVRDTECLWDPSTKEYMDSDITQSEWQRIGEEMGISAELSAPVGPMKISNISESSVDTEWEAPKHDGGSLIKEYIIKYRLANTSVWEKAGNVDGNTYRFSVKDLKYEEYYYFKVTAVNNNGPGPPLESIDRVKLLAELSAPVGPMKISNISESSVDTEWEAPKHDGGSSIKEYIIEYRLANTSVWEKAGNVDGNTYRFSVKDLKYEEYYNFKVTAVNNNGPGPPLESIDRVKLLDIPNIDITERTTFMEAIASGSEVRRYVRIQVVGKHGVGKSSLVRRLLGEGIDDIKSTDGIDILKKCQIRRSDGEWFVSKSETERREMIERIRGAVKEKTRGRVIDTEGEQTTTSILPADPSAQFVLSNERCFETETKHNQQETTESNESVLSTEREQQQYLLSSNEQNIMNDSSG